MFAKLATKLYAIDSLYFRITHKCVVLVAISLEFVMTMVMLICELQINVEFFVLLNYFKFFLLGICRCAILARSVLVNW